VGDGINDSLALKSAYVSMAMGGIGSDIAANSADVVLVDDEVRKVSYLLQLSKKVRKKIRSNIFITMSINFWFILLAAFGLLSPTEGALIHIISALFVVFNSSALMTTWGLD
ncbi:MAG TPA: heavy metal translocating P-type ATPase, partial [Clostridiales bacterium]|nr:heavy metal translocating P-type ATPase [Clostridiales bacterium]